MCGHDKLAERSRCWALQKVERILKKRSTATCEVVRWDSKAGYSKDPILTAQRRHCPTPLTLPGGG